MGAGHRARASRSAPWSPTPTGCDVAVVRAQGAPRCCTPTAASSTTDAEPANGELPDARHPADHAAVLAATRSRTRPATTATRSGGHGPAAAASGRPRADQGRGRASTRRCSWSTSCTHEPLSTTTTTSARRGRDLRMSGELVGPVPRGADPEPYDRLRAPGAVGRCRPASTVVGQPGRRRPAPLQPDDRQPGRPGGDRAQAAGGGRRARGGDHGASSTRAGASGEPARTARTGRWSADS